MSFKTVFLAVGASQDDAEIDRAVAICDALGAHLVVLVLGIAPPPPASPYGVVSNDIWAGGDPRRAVRGAGPGRGSSRRGSPGPRVTATCEAQYIDRGTVATLAARFARYADLTLIPRAGGRGTRRCRPG